MAPIQYKRQMAYPKMFEIQSPDKKYEIQNPGLYVLFGMFHSKRTKLSEVLIHKTVHLMIRIHPRKKTLQKMFHEECKSVLCWPSMHPRPVAGAKGSWVAYGPITPKMYKKMEKRSIWADVANYIDDRFPYTGNIVRIKVVIHQDHSRDYLTCHQYRPYDIKNLDMYVFDSDDNSSEDEFDYDEYLSEKNKKLTAEDMDDATKKQKRITDFF